MKDLMNAEELADYLQITKTNLYMQRHRGEGPPAVKVGRYLRFRRQDVEAWLESKVEAAS